MQTIQVKKEVPVVAQYHTVVCGGGAAGWAAAVASARQGKKTALIEKFSFLGGTATAGLVVPLSGCYHKEKRVVGGICWEFIKEMEKMGAAQIELPKGHVSFDPEIYKLLSWRMVRDAGVDIYSNCYLSGFEKDDRRISHVLIESKNGTEAIKGDVFIDATGDADLCHMADVAMLPIEKELQPMSMCFVLGNVDVSTDLLKNNIHHDGVVCKQSVHTGIHQYLDEIAETEYVPQFGGPWVNTTMGENLIAVNITRTAGDGANRESLTQSEEKMRESAFRLVELLRRRYPEFKDCRIVANAIQAGIRETRHIEGVKTLKLDDLLNYRVPEDSILLAANSVDVHGKYGPTSNEYITLPAGKYYGIPYGCLVPKGCSNLLVAGRSISAEPDAAGAIRVMPPCMAFGQAAGIAAAMAIRESVEPKDVDVQKLRAELIRNNACL